MPANVYFSVEIDGDRELSRTLYGYLASLQDLAPFFEDFHSGSDDEALAEAFSLWYHEGAEGDEPYVTAFHSYLRSVRAKRGD